APTERAERLKALGATGLEDRGRTRKASRKPCGPRLQLPAAEVGSKMPRPAAVRCTPPRFSCIGRGLLGRLRRLLLPTSLGGGFSGWRRGRERWSNVRGQCLHA